MIQWKGQGMKSASDPKQYKNFVYKHVEFVYIYVAKNGKVRMPEFKCFLYYGQITLLASVIFIYKMGTLTILSSCG